MNIDLFDYYTKKDTHVKITPIECYNSIFVKREDKFVVCGAIGAKARSCYSIVKKAKENGYNLITTAGSRKSPQINIVSKICYSLNLDFVAHTPKGELGVDLKEAELLGAKIIQYKAGYNSVIIKRAREYAIYNNGFEVPFGMICNDSVYQTKQQVVDIPKEVKRIVIPVGSGVNLAGLLHGVLSMNLNIPVLGIVVGANPIKTLNKLAPVGWQKMVTLVKSKYDYHKEITANNWNGITLDTIYEAKCIDYLKSNDLFWIVGLRSSLNPKN